ncbi:homing endonuclease associated repeat-containing protein [Limosilactobacillus reuteri]|uniref:homing endonuclease associated repeat-containing protein n=1 Tax=Limosilactobacillus reuteri TaxID=1598 RepID=UPI001E424BFC|nr:hypothetical protein [Limosilactobacillus reuteri]UFK69182.1 hypothetical protein IVR12_02293 [Limosilactobacillus reuteri]
MDSKAVEEGIRVAYQKIKEEKGRIPLSREMPHLGVILKKYHTWNQFVAQMEGKAYYDRIGVISNEQILQEIRSLYYKLGYPPHYRQYKRSATARLRFGTWEQTMKKANIPYTPIKGSSCSLEEIDYKVNQIKAVGEQEFTWHQLTKKHHFPVQIVVRVFGSFKNFKKHYGISDSHLHLSRASVVAGYTNLRKYNERVTVKMLSNYFECSTAVMMRIIREVNHGKGINDLKKQIEKSTITN